MDIIDGLMTIKGAENLNDEMIVMPSEKENIPRYMNEAFQLGLLAEYALNKEKNKCKEKFEDLFAYDIFTLLLSELKELGDEIRRDKIDPRKTFEEIADCAAVLTGLIANLRDSLKLS